MAERISAVDNEVRLPSATSTNTGTTSASSPGPQNSSQRITRSSARQAANEAAANTSADPTNPPTASESKDNPNHPQTTSTPASKKRKADKASSPPAPAPNSGYAGRKSKRQKIPSAGAPSASAPSAPVRNKKKGKAPDVMDSQEYANKGLSAGEGVNESNSGGFGAPNPPEQVAQSASSSRKSSRNKRQPSGAQRSATPSASSSTRKSKRHSDPSDPDTVMTGTDAPAEPGPPPSPPIPHSEAADDSEEDDEDDDGEDALYGRDSWGEDEIFGGPGGGGLSGTLRALTGMMTGFSSRLRDLLNSLRSEDLSDQLIALQELSEILLVSNEDNLSGQFSPDSFVKELVPLMNKEESPEIMLLSCRCLANLMEAMPASVANVVYGGAVPVLCQKLLEISFIDLAEQALSTLEKISYEYPGSIVREGGLTACLSYLDFFATSTQRTAVTTAAHCCRNIPDDSFPVVRDVMGTLLGVLNSSDQRVVEQASLCVSGIVDSFGHKPNKLEELVSVDLLRAILRLLVPGGTNLVGSNIHTEFLRVLSLTARASPRLSAELFKLNVVDTLYQMLTGVSPPSGMDDIASKLDSVVIMQALIHRPREQILETLNVISYLLPSLPRSVDPASGEFVQLHGSAAAAVSPASLHTRRHSNASSSEKRLELLKECPTEVRRFALILFPTLTDAYSSTVNLLVRQRVLIVQLKMLSNLDTEILSEALIPVPYASFLASILSQQDHPSLVLFGLQAAEMLLGRLDSIYRYQFYREGVMSEINTLANQEDPKQEEKPAQEPEHHGEPPAALESEDKDDTSNTSDHPEDRDPEDETSEEEDGLEDPGDPDDEDEDDDLEYAQPPDHMAERDRSVSSDSEMSVDLPPPRFAGDNEAMKSRIRQICRKFVETHESEERGKEMRAKAQTILDDLSALAGDLGAFFIHKTASDLSAAKGRELFTKLASYFDSSILESVTSAELLGSGLVRVLLDIFSNPNEELTRTAQSTFLEVFMGYTVHSKPKTATVDSPATPFSVMVHKLQDLLSRSEHFEVITAQSNSFDGNRSSSASMLGKQIRLRLTADDDSDIPKSYRNIMVSIHAIATFKSLDEYLRPRISMSDRPRASAARRAELLSGRDGLQRALAAMTGAGGLPLGASAGARMGDRGSSLRDLLAAAGGPPPPPAPPTGAPTPSSSRSARKPTKKSAPQPETPTAQAAQPESSGEHGLVRRSSRHGAALEETPIPARPPPASDDNPQDTLECADEKQLTDDGEDLGDESALDAIVGELQDEMEDEQPPSDPSAVNMEVATGGKVTARNEDGERVPTPSSASLASRPAPPAAPTQRTPTPGSSSRSMSYARAIQSAPQDWHIQFTLDDKVVPSETTIYRAVHNKSLAPDHPLRNVWSATYTVKFKRVEGPPPAEGSSLAAATEGNSDGEKGLPASLTNHPTTASILQLLNVLHDLNANIEDVLIEKRNTTNLDLHREPLSQFVNTKLTAKLNRQLEEPLIVASNCLPGWSEDLARLYAFLFPFETRHLFLQCTSFGYARSMQRWQDAQANEEGGRRDRLHDRPPLGRLQRQKVRISRSKLLESAIKVMDLYGASQSILEVEYFEEVGTGLGPTLEFYSSASLEFSKKKTMLWRDMDSSGSNQYVSGQSGLFPRPLSEQEASTSNGERVLYLFKMLGKFVARSMIDSRIIDMHFNPVFFRIGETTSSGVKPSLASVKMVDPGLARSLMTIKNFALAKKEIDEDPARTPAQKVADLEKIEVDGMTLEDLCLDFTLPGYPAIELEEGGSQKRVNIDNVASYLEKVIDMTLGSGVRRQVDAFRSGFSLVFPYSALSAFTPEELVNLFGRADEDWSIETLLDSIKADHGFNMDSKSVRNLLHLMSAFDVNQRRDFLQFTTGSPKLPIGGFKSLTPMFTVVCKPAEEPYTSDDYLPSVMTCVNYLKLPNYSSLEAMNKQLGTAMKEGQGAFHLS